MYLKEIPCITLPYLTSVMCVNLSFAMVLDNTNSPDYQFCVKTMYQARDKEIVEVPWCSMHFMIKVLLENLLPSDVHLFSLCL